MNLNSEDSDFSLFPVTCSLVSGVYIHRSGTEHLRFISRKQDKLRRSSLQLGLRKLGSSLPGDRDGR
jgi:hypothetical protein